MKLVQKFQQPSGKIDLAEYYINGEQQYKQPDGTLSPNVNDQNPIWLNGVTATPNGNRNTTYDDWQKTNELERASDIHARRVRQSTRPIRRFIRKASQAGLNFFGKVGNFFNRLITSGAETDFGQTSPFSDIDRQVVQKSRRRFGKKVKDKIEEYSPFLSPTSYLAAIRNNSLDPRYGAEIISHYSPEAQLGLLGLDMFLLGRNTKLPRDYFYWGKKGIGHLTEDFRFPENARIPLKYDEPSTIKFSRLDKPVQLNNVKYKMGYDAIDKLMVDDMVYKFKNRYGDLIDMRDAEGAYKVPRDYFVKEFEDIKNQNYYVGDMSDVDYGGMHLGIDNNLVDRISGRATGTHEGIMHESDRLILDLKTPYQQFADKLQIAHKKNVKFFPQDWREVRATMGEVKRKLLQRIRKEHPELPLDMEQYRPYYIDYINNLSDRKLRRLVKTRGHYGFSYHRHRRNNPNYMQDLRDLLINGI